MGRAFLLADKDGAQPRLVEKRTRFRRVMFVRSLDLTTKTANPASFAANATNLRLDTRRRSDSYCSALPVAWNTCDLHHHRPDDAFVIQLTKQQLQPAEPHPE